MKHTPSQLRSWADVSDRGLCRASREPSIDSIDARRGLDRLFADVLIMRDPALLETATHKSPTICRVHARDHRDDAPICEIGNSIEVHGRVT
jgi:hypothetical protein